MLVVVLVVSGVSTAVVHVVDVVPVRNRDVATSRTVQMVMRLMYGVAGGLTFVVVTFVLPMKVAVVHIVDVIPMGDRDVTASFAVRMIVFEMLVVERTGHCFLTARTEV